ncbi:MAG: heavy metal translocating P-type ATPase [Eikenella sp.]|nr:heavy metal translocating P-type ATPase [Eikenella sp.]
MLEKARFHIEGMSCQACANRIEKVLNKKDFVSEATVNFANEEAQVSFDAARTDAAQIAALIGKAGFHASLHTDGTVENADKSHWRVWLLLALCLPFAVGMAGMLLGTHAWMPPLWIQFALASVVQCWLMMPFYRSAWHSIRGGLANMDVLVSAGTTAIYLYSAAMWLLHGSHAHDQVYFEAGVMVAAFVSLGKYWEERTKRHSLNSLGLLLQLTPKEAVRRQHGQWHAVPLAEVRPGDELQAKHGGRIAADGVVLAGEGWADESHLTGESEPQAKQTGSRVLAGSVLTGHLEYRAEALGSHTLLGDMMQALAEAQGSKAPIARIADQVAAVFVPVVGLIALATFLLTWRLAGSAATALIHAVAVLVIACPCALGLATPAAIMAGMGVAVRHGIWFRDAAALEQAAGIDTVILDKTGTLTQGRPEIAAVWLPENGNETLLWQAAAAVEQLSLHPLAQAIVAAAANKTGTPPAAEQAHTEAGQGMSAQVAGIGEVRVGTPEYCGFGLPEMPDGVWPIASVAAVSVNGRAAGAFALADALKPDSLAAVQRLQQHGIEVRIMSGDRQSTVDYIAAQLGIQHAQGRCSPRDKAAAIQALQQEGRRVAMAGDGINDAPALAAADAGFAMRGGADAAEHAASATLMQHSVQQVADALLIARATLRHIRQNLFFAFFYNSLGIPLAAFGLLTPVLAGAAMALSSVSVLGNAMRLKRYRPETDFR